MIVFDLDDTLYLERDFAFSGYNTLDRYIEDVSGLTGFGAHCREAFLAGQRSRIFNKALGALGLPDDKAMIADLVTRYREHTPDIVLCDDARRCLDRVSQRIELGLITDGPERTQRAKILALEIAPYFQAIRPTGAWGAEFSKPHARAYIEMEDNASGPSLVYVADNALKDFVTPKARGWFTVQICRDGRVHTAPAPDKAHEPHATIETLDELETVLSQLGF